MFVMKTAVSDLKVGDRVFVPGRRRPQVITKIDGNKVTVKTASGTCQVTANELDRAFNSLSEATR